MSEALRKKDIRAMLALRSVHLEPLGDVVVSSGLTVDDVRRLVLLVTALLDEATDTGSDTAPLLSNLDALNALKLPAPIKAEVLKLLAAAVLGARIPGQTQ